MQKNNFDENIFVNLYTPYKKEKLYSLEDEKNDNKNSRKKLSDIKSKRHRIKIKNFTNSKLVKVATTISCAFAVFSIGFLGYNLLNSNNTISALQSGEANISSESILLDSNGLQSFNENKNYKDEYKGSEEEDVEKNKKDEKEGKSSLKKTANKNFKTKKLSSQSYNKYLLEGNTHALPQSNLYNNSVSQGNISQKSAPKDKSNDNRNSEKSDILLVW